MPHTGIIDEALEGEQELLMRAKLHLKGGLDRFSQGMIADAIAAIYDAISSAMQRFEILDRVNHHLIRNDNDDVSDYKTLFKVLLKSGIFDDATTEEDFDFIEQTLDDACEDQLETFDETSFLEISIGLLNQLGVVTEEQNTMPQSISRSLSF
ncbi:hypothetical protein E4H12_07655 [Candidatus Thorarchaeota archaeon]|nr:MAG: hypothetical protein E4H12_07655 [Candidatus Thorarchaeota archaeon]